MKIEDVPVGKRFRVIDPESDAAGLIFVRTSSGAEVESDPERPRKRTLEGWEDVEIIE